MRKPSSYSIVIVLTSMMFASCDDIDALRREKQIKTYWALTRAGVELTEISRTRSLTAAVLDEVVGRHLSDKRDFWGHPILIATTSTGTHVDSYVLVSFGSDGRPDRSRDEYFKVEPHSVRRSLKLDIIVRDGEPISLAGK